MTTLHKTQTGATAIHRFNTRSRRTQAALSLASVSVYIVTFFLLHAQLGAGAAIFVTLPVAVIAWFGGSVAGLLAALLSFLLTTLLLNVTGEQPAGWDIILRVGGGPGMTILIPFAIIVGQLHDLDGQVKHQLAERRQTEAALRESERNYRELLVSAQRQTAASEFAALYDTAHDLTAQVDLHLLLQTITERAMKLLNASGGAVYLYDTTHNDLELVVTDNFPLPIGTRLQMGQGIAGRVAQTCQPMIVDNYSAWEHRLPEHASIPFGAAVQVPMLYHGKLIGVLDVTEVGRTERKFNDADVRLLSLFGAQAASAVHNARLFDETRQRLSELEAINRISSALRAARTLDEMLPIILDETLKALNITTGTVWLYDAAADELRQVGSRSWAGQTLARLNKREGIVGHVFTTGQPYVSRSYRDDPHTHPSAISQIPDKWGGAGVPIRTASEIIGVLFVSVQLPRELTAGEVNLLTTLAEIAGNAIHRMRLHEQMEQRLRHLSALHTIDTTISASLDLRVSLNVLLDQITTQLNIDAAAVLLLNPHNQLLEYVAGRGFRSAAMTQAKVRIGEYGAGRVALESRIVMIPDLAETIHRLARAPLLANEGFVSYLGAPLIAKGQVKGVLELFHRKPMLDTPEWLDFLEAVVVQAAIAIDNATLFENLQRAHAELSQAYDTTLEGWSRALALREDESAKHTERVTEMALCIARSMGLSGDELVHIRRGALLHDIGKIQIPSSILLKSGPLSDEEWALVHKHPIYAYEMLAHVTYLRPALEIPYCHHEKWDGTGYPRGLKGEQIPLIARIFAIADAWDALTSHRTYRAAWSHPKAYEYISAQVGRHFDPHVVAAFKQVINENSEYLISSAKIPVHREADIIERVRLA